jgi:hypothetical protein
MYTNSNYFPELSGGHGDMAGYNLEAIGDGGGGVLTPTHQATRITSDRGALRNFFLV